MQRINVRTPSVTETFLGDNEIIFLMKRIEIKVHSFNFILKVKLFKFPNVFVLVLV